MSKKSDYVEKNAAKGRVSSQLVQATGEAAKAEAYRSKAQGKIDAAPFSKRDDYNAMAKEVYSARGKANKTAARRDALKKLAK